MKRSKENKLVEPKGREYRGLLALGSLFTLVIFLFWPKTAFAQVVINEILPNPPGGSPESDEYIEIYSNDIVNLSGWILDDVEDGSGSYTIPEGTQVGGEQKFRVFYKSVTGIGLNNSDPDMVRLFKPGETSPEDSYSFDIKSGYEGVAFGRVSDGPGGTWVELVSNSPGEANSPAPTPTSIPTSTPTPTPTPTKKLTPTSTPKPTSSGKDQELSLTASPTSSPSPPGEILGEKKEATNSGEATSSVDVLTSFQSTTTGSATGSPLFLILGGISLLAGGTILAWRKRKHLSSDFGSP